jgi:uncharacterized surface protein with fasciclin (FAS1) repeats
MTMHATARRSLTTGLAAAALAATATVATGPADAVSASHHQRPTSLAEVLAADGHHFDHNWGDFDILDKAVSTVLAAKPDSAVGVLAQPKTELTAFLPTDEAFRDLVETLTGRTPATERRTFRLLADATDVDTIEAVLLYHVVPGLTLDAKKVLASDRAKLPSAQGGTVTVRVRPHSVRLADADPDVRNPHVVATDINKGNPQIAHAIDGVLLPVDLP